jgi:cell division protein FtsB
VAKLRYPERAVQPKRPLTSGGVKDGSDRALAARVTDLEKENALLRAELREVTRMADYRQARIDQLEQTVASQHDEIARLEAEVATLRAERAERIRKEG